MNSEEKKLLNDYKVLKMRKRLELYDSDIDKSKRISENICKYCIMYMLKTEEYQKGVVCTLACRCVRQYGFCPDIP